MASGANGGSGAAARLLSGDNDLVDRASLASVSGGNNGKIVFALIACGRTVLAEYTATSGNFPTVTRVLLSKITSEDSKMSYVYDSYAFHYVVEDGVVYLCLTDEQMKRRVPFAFLEDIKERFKATYSVEAVHAAVPFAMDEDFSRVLRKQMEYYSEPGADKYSCVKVQIDDLKGTMVENIEKLLQRGEKIELLVDKTDHMQQTAFKFERSAQTLKNVLWWKNCKMYSIIVAIVMFVLYFVLATVCGGLDMSKCF